MKILRNHSFIFKLLTVALVVALAFVPLMNSSFAAIDSSLNSFDSRDDYGYRSYSNDKDYSSSSLSSRASSPDGGGYRSGDPNGGGYTSQGSSSDSDTPSFAPDRVIVKLKQSDPDARLRFQENSRGRRSCGRFDMSQDLGENVSESRLINPSISARAPSSVFSSTSKQNNMFVLTLNEPGEENVLKVVERLNRNPRVEYATPDYYLELFEVLPNDPQYIQQWALEKIGAPAAWEITTGSADVVVGIIDTGIDGAHPDLKDNLWVNPNPGVLYENDIHGYDFVAKQGGIPYDNNGHGTHVAGIVGASTNNNIGVTGVNWNVQLAWLGVCEDDNYLSISGGVEAVNYAQNNNIPIINTSWGGREVYLPLQEAIENYDGLFITAAGNVSPFDDERDNDTIHFYPSDYDLDNIISVAATDSNDQLASFSHYGVNSVDIAAPGVGILSTWSGGEYTFESGTSMATPMVAGVAALIKAENPNYTARQIKLKILSSADRVDSLNGFISNGRRLNAYKALVPLQDVTGVVVSPETLIVEAGQTLVLRVSVLPEGSNQTVLWASSDTTIATVNSSGIITAKNAGTVTITATSDENTECYASAVVTVIPEMSEVVHIENGVMKNAILTELKRIDPNKYLLHYIKSKLYVSDVQNIKELTIHEPYLGNMEILRYFSNLKKLNINGCYVIERDLDLSACTKLTELDCRLNYFTSIKAVINGTEITLTSNGPGYVSVYPRFISGKIVHNAEATIPQLLIDPNQSPSKFINWTENGQTVSTSERYKLNENEENDLVANFEITFDIEPHELTIAVGEEATITSSIIAHWCNSTDEWLGWINYADGKERDAYSNFFDIVSIVDDKEVTIIGKKPGRDYLIAECMLFVNEFYRVRCDILVTGSEPSTHTVTNNTNDGMDVNEEEEVVDTGTPGGAKFPFVDVNEGQWFYDSVYYMWENELMNGVSDVHFDPNGALTRGMVVTVLYRIEESPDIAGFENPFSDVVEDKWYASAITWAAEHGIVLGFTETRFDPDEYITREQLAAILYRYQEYTGKIPPDVLGIREFADGDNISEYAKTAVDKIVMQGIMEGRPNNMFDPPGNATRSEFAAVIQRYQDAAFGG
ncbi:MAG: S8 family serine peptidase [Oscillospiraceae bacterium]|nr:S8 family serine peptidase [Oscillospiraceae bacterium]